MPNVLKLANPIGVGRIAAILLVTASCHAETLAVLAQLSKLVLTPHIVSVAVGTTHQFAVSGVWSDGSTTAPPVTYSATGGTITSAGLYTAGSDTGTYRVVATQQNGTLADTSVVTIADRTLTQVILTPETTRLTPSATFQFAVSGVGTDGATIAPPVTYTATGGTITAAGLYAAGVDTGTFQVIAVQQGGTLADTSVVTVSQYPNRPAGLPVIGDFRGSPRATNDGTAYAGRGTGQAFGFSWNEPWNWDPSRTEDDALIVTTDATNPTGSGNVLLFNWLSSLGSGIKAARTDPASFPSTYSTLYIMLRIYWDTNWDDAAHKFYYVALGSSANHIYITRELNGAGHLTIEGSLFTSTDLIRLPTGTFTNNAWNAVELVLHAESSPGAHDGAMEWYRNGSLIGSVSGVNLQNLQWQAFEWYGTANSINADHKYRIGELYIGAK